VLKAKKALAEAEAPISQRKSDQVAARRCCGTPNLCRHDQGNYHGDR
jgi:hypothetical protein